MSNKPTVRFLECALTPEQEAESWRSIAKNRARGIIFGRTLGERLADFRREIGKGGQVEIDMEVVAKLGISDCPIIVSNEEARKLYRRYRNMIVRLRKKI